MIPIDQYFSCIDNKSCHNLCTYLTPPRGYSDLLGLGLNFCLMTPRPKNVTDESMNRFDREMRLKYLIRTLDNSGNQSDDD